MGISRNTGRWKKWNQVKKKQEKTIIVSHGGRSRRWWQDQWSAYEHRGTRQERSTLLLIEPGIWWLFAALLLNTTATASKLPRECNAWCQLLRSDSRCQRYVSDLSNVTPMYLGSEQKARVLLLWLTFRSRLDSLLLRWKTADTVFVVLSFSFQVWRYSLTVAMSLGSIPSTTRIRMHDC